VEGGVDYAWLDPLADLRPQHRSAGAAFDPHHVAITDSTVVRISLMDFQYIFCMPYGVGSAPCLRTYVVLGKNAAGGEKQREATRQLLLGVNILGDEETRVAAG